VSLFLGLDFIEKTAGFEFHTSSASSATLGMEFGTELWEFDSTTEINICSGKDGASPLSCTVSDFRIIYEFFNEIPVGFALGNTRIKLFENKLLNR